MSEEVILDITTVEETVTIDTTAPDVVQINVLAVTGGATTWDEIEDKPTEFPPAPHTHGNISNAGAIGSTADLVAVTGSGGVLITASRSGIDSRTEFPPAAHTQGWDTLTGTVDIVPFTTTNGGPTATGELAWLASTESLALRLKNGENLDVGEETVYHVDNNSGSTIAKGTAVSYAGTVGGSGKIRVKPWNGSTDAPESFMGFAMGAIPNGEAGYVTAFGVIRGVNTSAFSDGVILYANPSGTGLTATKPTTTHVIACLCVNASNNGTILVRPTVDKITGWDDVTGKPTSFPNADVSAATSAATANTLVERGANAESYFGTVTGGSEVNGVALDASGITLYTNDVVSTLKVDPAVTGSQNYLLPNGSGTLILNTDSRLTDARIPLSHAHGNITNDGRIGTTSNLVVTTTTGGALTTLSRSGIDSRTSFPNGDVTNATSTATASSLVRRDASAGAAFGFLTCSTLNSSGDVQFIGNLVFSGIFSTTFTEAATANRTITVPDASGTLAIISAGGDLAVPTSVTIGGVQAAKLIDPVRTTLTGNGATSTYAISGAAGLTNASALIVAIDGVLQEPSVDYNVSGGNITFTDPLANGAKAVVISPTNTIQVGQVTPSDGSVTSAKIAAGVTLTSPTIAGTAQFSDTTRPTTAGTGVPASSSLISREDSHTEQMRNMSQLMMIMPVEFATTTASGGFAGQGGGFMNLVTGTTASAYARAIITSNIGPFTNSGTRAACSVPVAFAFSLIHVIPTSANTEYRFVAGEIGTGNPIALGTNPLDGRGFGFRIYWSVANSRIEIQVFAHNGTTFVESTPVEFGPTTSESIPSVMISNDGAGTIKLFLGIPTSPLFAHVRVPDTPIITLSGGPSDGTYFRPNFSHIVQNGATPPSATLNARPSRCLIHTGTIY